MENDYMVFAIGKEDQEMLKGAIPPEALQDAYTVVVASDKAYSAIGAVAVEKTADNMLDVSYIVVDEAYRRKGIARDMLHYLRALAASYGMDGVEMSFSTDEEGEALKALAQSAGFSEEEEHEILYRFTLEEIVEGARRIEPGAYRVDMVFLNKLPSTKWNEFRNGILKYQERQLSRIKESDEEVSTDNVYPDLGSMDRYLGDISFIATEKRGPGVFCCLFEKYEDGLILRYLASMKTKDMSLLFSVVKTTIEVLQTKYSGDTYIYANAANAKMRGFLVKLTRGKAEKYREESKFVFYV